ncbi:MAG: DNA-binding NtrC family response regulator [Bradymonadia bacterium]|jgi:DNA-binding NtrC family response regulator
MSEAITRTVMLDDQTEALRLKRFLLTIDEPGAGGRHRVFGQRLVRFGSHPDNDVVLEDPSVSRVHFEIRVESEGYRLVDLDSKNGTYLGEVRVRDVYLGPNAAVHVGGSTIKFETTEEDVEVLLSGRSRFGQLIGKSARMREVFATLERVANSDARLLIQGAPGAGKEHAAEAVHNYSKRRGGEFVVLDCSAVDEEQVQGELFGDESLGDVAGALELAATGTLYLLEPTELPADVQAMLARALDRGDYRRVGAQRAFPLTARIVTGADEDLRRAVERGDLREDLYYQLAVVSVELPALRDRAEDIPVLVEYFLEAARKDLDNEGLNVTYATMERLVEHPWPGNVAELRNFIQRAVALSSADAAADDSRFINPIAPTEDADEPSRAVHALMKSSGVDVSIPFKDAKSRLVEAFEKAYWEQLLLTTGGNVSAAARVAGVHRKSVEYILKKHEISRRDLGK